MPVSVAAEESNRASSSTISRTRRRAPAQRNAVARAPRAWAVPGIVFVAAYFGSIVAGAWYAFTNWNGVDARADFIGLRNFKEFATDPVARGAVLHTLELTIVTVVLTNVFGLALAVGVNRGLRLRNYLRTVFFAPAVLSPLAVSYIWLYIFNSDGVLNGTLRSVGLRSWTHLWLGDPSTAIWAVAIVLVWQYTGLTMTIYLAGLQAIPDEMLEAAAVDGASHFQRFRKITLPCLAPSITIAMTLPLIFGLRVFDQVIGLTSGGPAGATETLATQVYEQTFVNGRFGYGSAIAVCMTLVVAAAAVAQTTILRRREFAA